MVKFLTFDFQCSCLRDHSSSVSSKPTSFRKKCSVSANSGVLPQMRQAMPFRSRGSRVRPQLSHWSPRAPSKSQWGQTPST